MKLKNTEKPTASNHKIYQSFHSFINGFDGRNTDHKSVFLVFILCSVLSVAMFFLLPLIPGNTPVIKKITKVASLFLFITSISAIFQCVLVPISEQWKNRVIKRMIKIIGAVVFYPMITVLYIIVQIPKLFLVNLGIEKIALIILPILSIDCLILVITTIIMEKLLLFISRYWYYLPHMNDYFTEKPYIYGVVFTGCLFFKFATSKLVEFVFKGMLNESPETNDQYKLFNGYLVFLLSLLIIPIEFKNPGEKMTVDALFYSVACITAYSAIRERKGKLIQDPHNSR